jgi:MFS family permease
MSSPSCSRSGGAVVAFDVVGTDTKAALFDTTGRMLGLSRTPTPHRGADTAGAVLDRVQDLTLQFRRDSPDVTPIVASLIAGVLAPLPLVLCRFIQGFGAGAEQSGGATLLTETAQRGKRGPLSSFVMIGAALGTALGAVVWNLAERLSSEAILSWGWRAIFFSSCS